MWRAVNNKKSKDQLSTYLRNRSGQILVEAVVVTAFMFCFLLFIDKLIIYNKSKIKQHSFLKEPQKGSKIHETK